MKIFRFVHFAAFPVLQRRQRELGRPGVAGRRLAMALVLAAAGAAPAALHAQSQAPGMAVSTTTLLPVTEVTTDPLTGISTTQTTRTVILDIKHTDNPLFNGCTDEIVVVNGTFTLWMQVTESSSGRVTEKYHQESNGTGVSTTGAHYSYGSTADRSSTYGGPSLTEESTDTVEEHLVRAGETQSLTGDDFFIKNVIHSTVVNNVPTATVWKVEAPCR